MKLFLRLLFLLLFWETSSTCFNRSSLLKANKYKRDIFNCPSCRFLHTHKKHVIVLKNVYICDPKHPSYIYFIAKHNKNDDITVIIKRYIHENCYTLSSVRYVPQKTHNKKIVF